MNKKIKIINSLFLLVIFTISIYCIFYSVSVGAVEKKNTYRNTSTVFVDIKGAVKNPGVYEVSSNSRIIDVIKKAGNLKKNADTSIINLSKKVKDEMYIIIYTKEELSDYKEKILPSSKIVKEVEEKIICPDTDNDGCINNSSSSYKININNASLSELSSLTGIGEGKAKKIIEYREKNKFENIEDIKNVPGIGNSLYEKIKDNIEI